jgi:hypothetical protein
MPTRCQTPIRAHIHCANACVCARCRRMNRINHSLDAARRTSASCSRTRRNRSIRSPCQTTTVRPTSPGKHALHRATPTPGLTPGRRLCEGECAEAALTCGDGHAGDRCTPSARGRPRRQCSGPRPCPRRAPRRTVCRRARPRPEVSEPLSQRSLRGITHRPPSTDTPHPSVPSSSQPLTTG